MTMRARSVTGEPPRARPRMPLTHWPSKSTSWTVNPSRSSAPAATAASTRILSSTERRGQYASAMPSAWGGNASEGERTEVKAPLEYWRAVAGDDFLQQAPALELSDTRLVEVVGGHD